jgi:hypothetical protein
MVMETDEIEANVVVPLKPLTWDKARRIARNMLPGEGEQLRDNLAESLIRKSVAQWFIYQRERQRA